MLEHLVTALRSRLDSWMEGKRERVVVVLELGSRAIAVANVRAAENYLREMGVQLVQLRADGRVVLTGQGARGDKFTVNQPDMVVALDKVSELLARPEPPKGMSINPPEGTPADPPADATGQDPDLPPAA